MSGRADIADARIDFDFIYSRLMSACGYTPAEIDEMTLHDVFGLFAYWRDYPPTHEILKSIYGVQRKPEAANRKSEHDPSGIGSLIARFPDGFVRAVGGGGGHSLGQADSCYLAATQP